jgi:hypothetical protein
VLAFADPEIIRLARDEFVAVVGDDWYQRRRNDPEGKFFRNVTDQAGRGSSGPDGGSTRQAIYCLTASGKLLYWKNAGQLPGEMRKALHWGLEAWRKLPESERKPGAIKVEDIKLDPRYKHAPPPGGLIVNVFTRALERDAKGELRPAESKVNGVNREPQRDHLWLTEAEWKALIPAHPKPEETIPVPAAVQRRIFQFHLVDSTLGEPVLWTREQIRSGRLTLTVTEVTATSVYMRLDGSALLATDANVKKAERGYDVRLLGQMRFDVGTKRLDRFDIVALGECWGKNPIYGEGRLGRDPLGVAFELAQGDAPADRVPPQGARWLPGYLQGAE